MKTKVRFRDALDLGAWILVISLVCFTGLSMWNSNQSYPPPERPPIEKIDQYKIITIDGECWVLPGNEYLINAAIMKGDHLGQCLLYLRNLDPSPYFHD